MSPLLSLSVIGYIELYLSLGFPGGSVGTPKGYQGSADRYGDNKKMSHNLAGRFCRRLNMAASAYPGLSCWWSQRPLLTWNKYTARYFSCKDRFWGGMNREWQLRVCNHGEPYANPVAREGGHFIFFPFIFISWRLITLQYCSGFCHTLTWISHGFTCVPHPIPLGLPSAPALSTCLMHPTWAGDLFHPW